MDANSSNLRLVIYFYITNRFEHNKKNEFLDIKYVLLVVFVLIIMFYLASPVCQPFLIISPAGQPC
jgi:hypothetical protein